MAATLEELQARIQRLEDIKQIEHLQKIYGYYSDYGEWQKIVDLFADNDASVEEADRGVYKGKEGISRYYLDLLGNGGKPQRAGWLWTFPFGGTLGQYWLHGYYENEFVKENGRWLFKKLFWNTTFYTRFETGWIVQPIVGFLPMPNPDNPPTAFHPYPSGYRFPYSFPHPVTGQMEEPVFQYHHPMAV